MVWTQCDVTHWSPRGFTEKLRTHPLPDQCWAENKFRKGQISCGTLQEQGHCYLNMYTHIGNIFSAVQVFSQRSSYVSATVQLSASLTVHEQNKPQSCLSHVNQNVATPHDDPLHLLFYFKTFSHLFEKTLQGNFWTLRKGPSFIKGWESLVY